MSDTEIRIAIAEVCGTLRGFYRDAPDYPNDLNAMAEAEKSFDKATRHSFAQHLWKIVVKPMPHIRTDDHLFAFCNVTARQRAEAFLRTIGKWKDS